jgi:site-specific DNA-cytosine methylase
MLSPSLHGYAQVSGPKRGPVHFPDWLEFSGSRIEDYVQIGNAVPRLLDNAVGDHLIALFGNSLRQPPN